MIGLKAGPINWKRASNPQRKKMNSQQTLNTWQDETWWNQGSTIRMTNPLRRKSLNKYSYEFEIKPKAILAQHNTMESKRDSMGHLGTHLVSVGLKGAKMDLFWVAIFRSG